MLVQIHSRQHLLCKQNYSNSSLLIRKIGSKGPLSPNHNTHKFCLVQDRTVGLCPSFY